MNTTIHTAWMDDSMPEELQARVVEFALANPAFEFHCWRRVDLPRLEDCNFRFQRPMVRAARASNDIALAWAAYAYGGLVWRLDGLRWRRPLKLEDFQDWQTGSRTRIVTFDGAHMNAYYLPTPRRIYSIRWGRVLMEGCYEDPMAEIASRVNWRGRPWRPFAPKIRTFLTGPRPLASLT